MTDKAISPLRRRLLEDMVIRRLSPKTQHDYIRHVKGFADFVGCSPGRVTAEDVHRYQTGRRAPRSASRRSHCVR
jgi:integrase/recombinase XerD